MSHKPSVPVSETLSHVFRSLPKDYFRIGYIPRIDLKSPDQEVVMVNKIGGSKPFLGSKESWPRAEDGSYLTFICQFFHPTYKRFVRLFLNLKNPGEGQFDQVETNQTPQTKPMGPLVDQNLPCYQIMSWHKVTELIDFDAIYKYYSQNVPLFQTDFKHELQELDLTGVPPATAIYSLLNHEYNLSDRRPSCPILKVEGTPYSKEAQVSEYLEAGTILQICNSDEIPLPFTVGHIMTDEMDFVYEL